MESNTEIRRPALQNRDKEMVPKTLLRAMFGLVLLSLVLVTYAVVTGREHVGKPEAAAVLREKSIILAGADDGKAVTVSDASGKVLLDLSEGGFIAVIHNGLRAERRKYGVDMAKPIRVVEYANGRLTAEDPETGWSVELYAFGKDNEATFRRLLDL